MISLGQEQHLGHKAFLLLWSKRSNAAIVFLVIALVVLALKQPISSIISYIPSFGGSVAGTYVIFVSFGSLFIALILFLIGYVIAHLTYSHYTFTFEEYGLRLKQGIFSVHEVSIPYRQMQDVNVERSLMYRMMGVSRVVIDSAGHEQADEHADTDIMLEPIDRDVAEDIRTMLQEKMGVQVVESEKSADAGAAANL